MDMPAQKGALFTRRNFLQQSATVGMSLLGFELLGACGSATSSGSSSGITTASINTLPPSTNPGAVYVFNQTVKQFEQSHPHTKIVGKNDPYDPSTYFVKLSANQMEDAVESYFTEPPLLIKKHAAADISDLAKSWQYFSSYNPGISSIATDPTTGKIYGIPVTGYALGIWYNRKLFKAAGLDPDKPPTTWEEFRGYAKQLTSSSVAGYAETSSSNQGGWHFTNWMYTAGGDMQSADGTKVLFNSPKGVSVLQLLKEMRFTDQSMTKQQLLNQDQTLQLLATNKVAMVVMAPDMLDTLKSQYQAKLEDFGMGPMPQNGGNAALTGGNIFIFNPKSAREVIKTAFDFVIYSNFDPEVMESNLARKAAAGQTVGAPSNILFTGDFQHKINELNLKYANVPTQNYTTFANSKLTLRPEPRNQTQKMYATLDSVVQTILTNANADPQALLKQAAEQFQQVLDQSAS
ncbi:extracellular solute-binding protein [Ktedonosporobacter rubrisoli]|uniref:Extracellular solute-binding protein n=1 Tax=Ktedonosporobacter rubrisoli TaxID=2509675 RepID=A0A4P6JNX8_KTERU|nr:extracellular solute-binding protein [Ktedonosporobacter rubrisoli]QBD76945.1 extracellular solute-binding protein [Ktedonosporobacter rubrisoli]